MTTTAPTEVDADQLQPGTVIHFLETVAVTQSDLAFAPPIITARGTELTLTPEILAVYGYPERESFLTRLGQPDRNGRVLADRGPWPDDKLKSLPGSPERRVERDAAVGEVWEQFGPGFSADKAAALREVDKRYGPQTDSWSFSASAGARG